MKLGLLALTAILISSAGCGTVCNLVGGITHPQSEPRVYGGVARDLEVLDDVVKGVQSGQTGAGITPQGGGPGAAVVLGAIVGIAVADPILSFVADTVTLPLTIPLQNRRIAKESSASHYPSDSNPVDP
jgi:hypothetical protein